MPCIGEVVPAREGLRPLNALLHGNIKGIGEVVPAREGLRQFTLSIEERLSQNRRSGSSKRRIKTKGVVSAGKDSVFIGEVVPAREGLRRYFSLQKTI